MTAKETILNQARELFNRQGTARVTTNHIARAAGISPGNLYYHYHDKNHIIREIYEQMVHAWEAVYTRVEGKKIDLYSLQVFTEGNFEMLWEYRFFYREVVALLNADPVLYPRHVEIFRERFLRQRALLQHAIQDGLLNLPETEAEMDDLLTIAWIVANHYLIHLETFGRQIDKDDFTNGARLVMKVFTPYLASKVSLDALSREDNKREVF